MLMNTKLLILVLIAFSSFTLSSGITYSVCDGINNPFIHLDEVGTSTGKLISGKTNKIEARATVKREQVVEKSSIEVYKGSRKVMSFPLPLANHYQKGETQSFSHNFYIPPFFSGTFHSIFRSFDDHSNEVSCLRFTFEIER